MTQSKSRYAQRRVRARDGQRPGPQKNERRPSRLPREDSRPSPVVTDQDVDLHVARVAALTEQHSASGSHSPLFYDPFTST